MSENGAWVKRLAVAANCSAYAFNPILGVFGEDGGSNREFPGREKPSMSTIAFDRRRLLYVGLSILASLVVLTATHEKVQAAGHTFVLPASSGYGISDCLGKTNGCDEVVASAWCESKGYGRPLAYGKAEDAVTSSIGTKSGPASVKSDPNDFIVTCGE
jgi:hypothetical protein